MTAVAVSSTQLLHPAEATPTTTAGVKRLNELQEALGAALGDGVALRSEVADLHKALRLVRDDNTKLKRQLITFNTA